jgi:hypothetical protein
MRPHPQQSSIRVRPATYTAAVYVLGAVLLMELGMIISIFWIRAMVVPINFTVPKAHAIANAAALGRTMQPMSEPAGIPGEIPNLKISSGHGLLALPSGNDNETQIINLLAEVKLRARQKDIKGELDLLLKAEDIDPRNPDVLQGLGEIYYLIDDKVRSKIYWQRLVDLGPAIGAPYALARDKVLLNSSPDADTLSEPSPLGRVVFIDGVDKTPVQTLNGGPQFQVRTSLMRKDPNMADFDQKKLQLFVIFYQQMPDGTLAPDLRPHKSAFDDLFLFWNKKPKESFTVSYTMPDTDTPGPDGKPMGKYYGFIIGIYYDKTLQDVRSEPADLVTRLPLPDAIE